MKKYHYTYEIVYTSGLRYIGSRTSKKPPEDDTNYCGSGKYCPNKSKIVSKIILGIFNTRKEALAHEIYLHKINDIARNPRYYNRARQTSTGFTTEGQQNIEIIKMLAEINRGRKMSDEMKERLRQSKLGIPRPEYVKEKLRKANLGKKHSEDSKRKQRQTFIENGLLILGDDGKYHLSDTQKKKLSESLKGRVLAEEHKKKISMSHIGIRPSEETRKKISMAHRGKKRAPASEERKQNISEALKGKSTKYTEPVLWINIDTNEKIFDTPAGIAKRLNLNSSDFCAVMNGKQKTTRKWKLHSTGSD